MAIALLLLEPPRVAIALSLLKPPMSGTVICDEDGLYDPTAINDRLLLGIKRTLSEAELHLIRARLQGGLLAKARRGELRARLPVGPIYDQLEQVVLDPHQGVRDAIAHLHESFEQTGSAQAVVKHFASERLKFPGRHHAGPHAGELYWGALRHKHVLSVLHNQRYAGAYFYGRHRQLTGIDGRRTLQLKPLEQWTALIPDAHPCYITFEQHEKNQATLSANAAARGQERLAGPPREGPALLQGIVVCGKCARRMSVSYHKRSGALVPDYVCRHEQTTTAQPSCQSISAQGTDKALAAPRHRRSPKPPEITKVEMLRTRLC